MDLYGSYNSLGDAAYACTTDTGCLMVYDSSCDGPPYQLCSSNLEKISTQGSCIYKKQGNTLNMHLSISRVVFKEFLFSISITAEKYYLDIKRETF